jgi:hypothetical protein
MRNNGSKLIFLAFMLRALIFSMLQTVNGNGVGSLDPMLSFFKYLRQKIQRKNWRFRLKTKPNFEKS